MTSIIRWAIYHAAICGNDDDNEKENKLRTRTTNDPGRPPPTKWLPMHAGKGPTTYRRRPLAVGPHVEPRCKHGPRWDGGPCPPGCVFVFLGGATFTVGGVSSDLGRSAKVARGELTHTHAHTYTHTHTHTHTYTRIHKHAHIHGTHPVPTVACGVIIVCVEHTSSWPQVLFCLVTGSSQSDAHSFILLLQKKRHICRGCFAFPYTGHCLAACVFDLVPETRPHDRMCSCV